MSINLNKSGSPIRKVSSHKIYNDEKDEDEKNKSGSSTKIKKSKKSDKEKTKIKGSK